MSPRHFTRLAVLLFLLPVMLSAQEVGEICGRVVDSEGRPLDSAVISLLGTPWGCYSSAQGNFLIVGLAPGDYQVWVSKPGRMASLDVVRVTGMHTAVVEVTLHKLVRPEPDTSTLSHQAPVEDQLCKSSRVIRACGFQLAYVRTGVSREDEVTLRRIFGDQLCRIP